MCRSCDLDLTTACHDREAPVPPLRPTPSVAKHDPVNHPSHYTGHPSGIECLEIVKHMNFCRGGAIKYIWRAGEKGDPIEDLEKARFLLAEEIKRLQASAA